MGAAARKLGPQWPTELSSFEMAKQINVSVRHLRDLKKKGIVFEGSKPGMYRYPESLHRYIDYRRKIAAEAHTLSPLTIERAQTAVVLRRLKEMDVEDRESRLISIDELKANWKDLAAGIKRAALSIPSTLASEISGLSAPDHQYIAGAVLKLLKSLAGEANEVVGADPTLLLPTDDERAGINSRRKPT